MPGPKPKPIESRYWSKVDKTAECWNWTAGRSQGYGNFGLGKGKVIRSHQMAWTLTYGPIPAGMAICHKCDNRLCCRPDHLFLGTQADNMEDMRAKARASQGSTRPLAKLDDTKVREMREIYAAGGIGFKKLGQMYGVTAGVAHEAVTGRTWKHVGP